MSRKNFYPGEQSDSQLCICPYCGHESGDCWEWVSEDEHETQCDGCDKTFIVWAVHSVDYYTMPMPDDPVKDED